MGEYSWAVMSVGGKGSHKLITEELGNAAEASFPGGDGDLSVDELIGQALKDGTAVTFQGECNYGNPTELMDFCRANGLAYHRSWSAVAGAFDAGLEYWTPDMDCPVEESANDDGEPMANLSWLKKELAAGRTLEAVIAELAPADAENVPPLVVDDLVARAEAA